jgi:ATP/maltotriose-dependent transcriptional regulator MalT
LRVATWRLDSASPADPALLTQAAQIANAVFDHHLAERLARRAANEGGGFRASLALGEALNDQGHHVQGEAVLAPLVSDATSDQDRADLAVARYLGCTRAAGFRREFELVLLEAEEEVIEPRLVAFLRAQRATLLTLGGRVDEGIALAMEDGTSVDERSRLRAVPALGAGWTIKGKADRAAELAKAMLDSALRHRDELPHAPFWVVSVQLMALLGAGRLDEADETISVVESAAAAGGPNRETASFLSMARGFSAVSRGQPRSARYLLQEGVHGAREFGPWRAVLGLAFLTEACALVGEVDGAVRASREADELVGGSGMYEGFVRRARSWAALAQGQQTLAAKLALDAADWSARNGHHAAELRALHDALRFGADHGAATRLLVLAPDIEGPLAPCLAAHARGVLDDNGLALEAAATRLEEVGSQLLAAEAAVQAAAAFSRVGLVSRRERSLAHAGVLAGRCEGARTPILEDLDQPLPLTPREREVAHLAAGGLSSSAIAERLFISTRTVEGHLHRLYTKLGVADRKALASLLRKGDVPTRTQS